MSYRTIEFEQTGAIAVIRLNQPATLNAVTMLMLTELGDALDAAVKTSRALVLGGAGRSFCSGGDLSGELSVGADGDGPDFGAVLESHINPLMAKLTALPIPWLTAVRGAAAGFGCALALAGDLVVASENATFLQAFARIGLVPDGGSTHLLVRGAGRVRAMEAMLLAEPIPAATALQWGLINRVVPDDRLDSAAVALARRLAEGPTLALGAIRNAAWQAVDADWSTSLTTERNNQRLAGRTRDAAEGIGAFQSKRAAVFEGR